MSAEIRLSAKSTPEAPLYLWRVWKESRPVAFGLAPSESEARSLAHLAAEAGDACEDGGPDLIAWLRGLGQAQARSTEEEEDGGR